MIARHNGAIAAISTSVDEGSAPVRLIRYAVDPADGWWFLAEEDLPRPKSIEDIRLICLHCIVDSLDAEIGAGMEAAKADAEGSGHLVGLAVWEGGEWLTGEDALHVLP